MSEREPHHAPGQPGAADEPPHDVLAAEEFPGPSPEEAIHEQGHVELPPEPSGASEPHDVLAAEEFAMPAPRHHGDTSVALSAPQPGSSRAPLRAGLAAAALGLAALLLRQRRRAAAAKRSKLAQLRERVPRP